MKKYLFLFIHFFFLYLKIEAGILEAAYYQEEAQRLINAYPSQLEKRKNRRALKKYIKKRCEQLETMKRFIPAYASILDDTYNYKISASSFLIVQSYKESIDARIKDSFVSYLASVYESISRSTIKENFEYYLNQIFTVDALKKSEQCDEELEYHHAFLAKLKEYPSSCELI